MKSTLKTIIRRNKMNSTKVFFNKYAKQFNKIYENNIVNLILNKLFRESIRLRQDKAISSCLPVEGKTVLDVGCGPGHYMIDLAKMGAEKLVGIDFAEEMISLAKEKASAAGVAAKCEFIAADFMKHNFNVKYNYAIITGFMDYIQNPEEVIRKVLGLTSEKALFSFPSNRGILAWQRKWRYKNRCELYLYDEKILEQMFDSTGIKYKIEKMSRDYFVTVSVDGK